MNLLHNTNIQVVDTWIEVFQKLLTEIPFPEIQKEVLAEIYDLSSICSSTTNKYSSIRMIASSIQYLGKNISDNLLNLIKLFSQFNDFQIKKSIVSEICPKLFQFLKSSQLDYDWLPLITEIIKNNNENKEIRCFAITTLSDTLTHFSSETKLDKIIPVLNYLISFDSDIDIVLTICKKLGPLIYHVRIFFQIARKCLTFSSQLVSWSSKFKGISTPQKEFSMGNNFSKQNQKLIEKQLEKELNQRDQNQALIKYIFESVDSKNEEIRENIIFNYPCILQLFGKKHKDKLIKLYIHALTKDEEIDVRIQAVKIIPEVVKFLGVDESKTLLKHHIKQMLGEKDNNEIRIELAKKLAQILEYIFQQEVLQQKQLSHQQHQISSSHNSNNGNQHPQSAPLSTTNYIQIFSPNNSQKGVGVLMIQEIFTEILNCIEQNTKSPCWRLVKSLLEIFQQTNNTFNFSIIQDKYSTILFKCITESNFELKKLAAKNLVLLIAQQKQQPQREYIFSQINSKLYSGRSYQLRMIYLEIVEECINKFSRSFFKQYNLIQSLQLYNDKVPNVRRKLATLIFKIRSSIFKEDAIHIDQFDSLIIHLLLDNDQETAKIAQQQHSNLKDIDSFQSTQDEQDADKIDEIQDFIEENEDEISINQPQKNYRSFDTIDNKNPYSISQIPSSLLSNNSLIKKKNINVKKIPSVGNTKSLSTPKNTSLTSISSNNASKGGTKNSTVSSSLVFKQNADSKKNRRNSSNSNDTTQVSEKVPTAHSLLVQKPTASLTQISGQQSSGSLLIRNKQNLSPIISSQNNQQNYISQQKILSQNTDYMNSNTQRDLFSDQNDLIRPTKERNSASLNKYNSLKPIQKSINKITPFNPSTTPQQNSQNQSSSQFSPNIMSNHLSLEKRANFERKGTFENNPNIQAISNNLYRIKKQTSFQPSSLPPKFALKKKPL